MATANAGTRDLAAFLYDASRIDRDVSLVEVDVDRLKAEQLLWIDVSDEPGIVSAAASLDLAPETLDVIHETPADPNLFVHEGYVTWWS
jgi:hypothetical protein